MTKFSFPTLELTYQPDFRDLFDASAQLRTRRYRPGQRLKLNLIAGGLMLIGGVFSAFGGTVLHVFVPAIPSWLGISALFILVALAYGKLLVPWVRNQSAEMIRAARPPGQMRFSADHEGVRWEDADIDFQLRWSGVEALFCTSGGIVFMSGVIGLVVPFTAFPDTAARRQFISAALDAMPAKAAETSRSDHAVQRALTA